ncbi:hypothetical protein [Williamsia serinedens]|uniref:Uncharacterized protein n=1 Tax=Williamsia serinedens TaxID=391736 RepID=A0ABT1GXN1_9NOCA|nr:hypothetical protein [Williamsia serinedens]MCP2159739.1 hypothetical protein [Williamsia serinedens]
MHLIIRNVHDACVTYVKNALSSLGLAERAIAALGGIAFITDPDVAYLGSVLQAFSYNPPSIGETHQSLFDFRRGKPFRLS